MGTHVLLRLASALAVIAATPTDAEPRLPGRTDTATTWLRGVEAMRRLPVTGLHLVKRGEDTFFVSDNGRLVIVGSAFDLWNGAPVTTLAEAERMAGRLDLLRLGLKPEDLGALRFGLGTEQVVAFVDPRCPHCRALLGQIPALADRYRFALVLLPVLGPESEALARRLACAGSSAPETAVQALLTEDYTRLPEPAADCVPEGLARARAAAQVIGVPGVPFVIAPDGRIARGAVADLGQWLAAEALP
jgi:thiol:disulfide interchange protein DsbC